VRELDDIDEVLDDGENIGNLKWDFHHHFNKLRHILASSKKDVKEIQFYIKELKNNWETSNFYSAKYPESKRVLDYQYNVLDLSKKYLSKPIYNQIYSTRRKAEEGSSGYIRITAS